MNNGINEATEKLNQFSEVWAGFFIGVSADGGSVVTAGGTFSPMNPLEPVVIAAHLELVADRIMQITQRMMADLPKQSRGDFLRGVSDYKEMLQEHMHKLAPKAKLPYPLPPLRGPRLTHRAGVSFYGP